MKSIRCRIAKCPSVFATDGGVAADAVYLCSKHSRTAQLKAIGRTLNPETDLADAAVRFQPVQFDKSIARKTRLILEVEPDDVSDVVVDHE